MKYQTQRQAQFDQLLDKIACCRRHVLKNSDPEAVHDLRVAVRGLRVMLSVLGPPMHALRQNWRALAQDTSPCRDLEVLLQLIDTLPVIPSALRTQLAGQEQAARRALTERLAQMDIPCLIQRSRSLLQQKLPLYRPADLQRRSLKRARRFRAIICKQIATLTPQAPPASWHQLRLDIKRLRYLLEYCHDGLGKDWLALHPALKQCQQALGDLHDLDLLIDISHCALTEPRLHKLNSAQAAVDALILTASALPLK